MTISRCCRNVLSALSTCMCMCCEDHGLYFILQSCRDILSLVFQIFHNIPTTPDAALTDRIQACVKVY